MRDYLKNACEQIDAAFFSGDEIEASILTLEEVKEYVERWVRQIKVIEENNAEGE